MVDDIVALYGIGYANMVYLNITHPEDSTDFYIAAYTDSPGAAPVRDGV